MEEINVKKSVVERFKDRLFSERIPWGLGAGGFPLSALSVLLGLDHPYQSQVCYAEYGARLGLINRQSLHKRPARTPLAIDR